MKKIIGGMALALALLTAGGCKDQKAVDQSAVQKVLDLARADDKTATGADTYHEDVYLNEIQKIDTSACPLPFQQAWLAYVQLFQRRASASVLVLHAAQYDKQSAWQQLELAALNYGAK